MSTRCILLIGFEPFDREALNPSLEIVRQLDGETIDRHRVVGAALPVVFADTPPLLRTLIEQHDPAIVLAIGQAGGRAELSLERIAINLVDARIADNRGSQPVDRDVVEDAPRAYFTTLPVKAMVAAMHADGVPAGLSLSAGSFVCNQVFYLLSHVLATRNGDARGGFLHVPWLPEQASQHPGAPSMALATMLLGVRAALAAAVATQDDLATPGGTTH